MFRMNEWWGAKGRAREVCIPLESTIILFLWVFMVVELVVAKASSNRETQRKAKSLGC